jgi:probable phosphoglycerate mutase
MTSTPGAHPTTRYRAAVADVPQAHRQVRFQPPPGATEVLLVRHGESAAFHPGQPFPLVDGHGDPPLHPVGEYQAERVADRLADEEIHAIYVTKLQRTAQTAAPLAARLGLEPVVDPDLHEVFLGAWEGGVLRQKAAEGDAVYLRVQAEQDWSHIPGAESWEVLSRRCLRGIDRVHAAHPDERVAVFVHGGVIGALLAHATGSRPFAFNGADNASIHHLVVLDREWKLRCFNDTSHLGGFTSRPEPLT